ncbi:hypothetical protein [Halovivax limisalsi]|uniref:hypothetical protein n=1 Tax=Halovivax limisalsi TaxID=1453760 RepID=UPI001FFD9452|nr:hypothetical protein [Halovivax limisalsi]
MADSGRTTRRDRIVAGEFVLLTCGFALAYWLDHLALWLGWAVACVVLAGVTLVSFNRGFEPADGD